MVKHLKQQKPAPAPANDDAGGVAEYVNAVIASGGKDLDAQSRIIYGQLMTKIEEQNASRAQLASMHNELAKAKQAHNDIGTTVDTLAGALFSLRTKDPKVPPRASKPKRKR